MYSSGDAEKDAYVRDLFDKNYRQVVRLTLNEGEETELVLTSDDVVQGSLTIDRTVVTRDVLEIGTAVAAELAVKIRNRDGQFDDVNFEGMEAKVEVGVKKWDAYVWENAQIEYIPMGYFTVDTATRQRFSIAIKATDRMSSLLDVHVDWSAIGGGTNKTVGALLTAVCTACDVVLGTPASSLLNNTIYINYLTGDTDALVYRNLIQWIATISGTCAYFGRDGKLYFGWINSTTYEAPASRRYKSTFAYNEITLTGMLYTSSDSLRFEIGNVYQYPLELPQAGIIQDRDIYPGDADFEDFLWSIATEFVNYTYLPFTASVKPAPYLDPLDQVTVVDSGGTSHIAPLTSITYRANAATAIESCGKSLRERQKDLSWEWFPR